MGIRSTDILHGIRAHVGNIQMARHLDYDQLAEEYARHRKATLEVVRRLVAGARIRQSSLVLEVGCGTGNYISAIQMLTGCSAFGCDPSGEMLSEAGRSGQPIQIREGRGESLPFPAAAFDFIFSVDVIHHMHDHQRYFHEASRVLGVKGKICTVTESGYQIRRRRPFATYFPETVVVDLRRYPPISELTRMMHAAGFASVRCEIIRTNFEFTDIQDFRDQAYSCLHLISTQGFQKGIRQMEQDLKAGPLHFISQYLLLWGTKK